MITLSIDEKDSHVLRVSASYLLALAGETVSSFEFEFAGVKTSDVEVAKAFEASNTPRANWQEPVFNTTELTEAEVLNNIETGDGYVPLVAASTPSAAEIFGGKSSVVAPPIVGVDLSQIAHADTTAITLINTPNVPLPPAANTPSAVATVAPPTGNPALDVNGLPWDVRIHSREKTKIASGAWKTKRGLNSDLQAQVEAELRNLMNIPLVGAEVATVQPSTPIVPAPPAITAPIVNPSSQPFPALMQKVLAAVSAKTLNNTQVLAIIRANGFEALPSLIQRPDLIPQVEAAIDAQIQLNVAGGVPV